MDTKLTVSYDNPVDPAAFESGYPDRVKLAKAMPVMELATGGVRITFAEVGEDVT